MPAQGPAYRVAEWRADVRLTLRLRGRHHAEVRKLAVTNLRSLGATGPIDLAPLVLLLGRNSTGKSTFLRLFPLLRQSVEVRTLGPILWFGDYVDFGSFAKAVRKGAADAAIGLSFELQIERQDQSRVGLVGTRQKPAAAIAASFRLGVELELRHDAALDQTYASRCYLLLPETEDTIEFLFAADGSLRRTRINGVESSDFSARFRAAYAHGILPMLEYVPANEDDLSYRARLRVRSLAAGERNYWLSTHVGEQLAQFITQFAGSERSSASHILDNLALDTRARSVADVEYLLFKTRGNADNSEAAERAAQGLRLLMLAGLAPALLEMAALQLTNVLSRVQYLAPLRASAERYYRSQELAVSELDAYGSNVAMFVRSLSSTQKQSLARWCEQTLGFSVYARGIGDHTELMLREAGSSTEFNLTDMGFGYSQVLPIAVQSWWSRQSLDPRRRRSEPTFLAIEQPELHLHPSHQARIADLLVATVSQSEVHAIVETHSEHLVQRVGAHVEAGRIRKEDVRVVLFEHVAGASEMTRVQQCSFDDFGVLGEWPMGFFVPDLPESV